MAESYGGAAPRVKASVRHVDCMYLIRRGFHL
jgi:hypothetical protein